MKSRFDLVEREKIVNDSQNYLTQHQGKPAVDYLINERKLSWEIIRRFSLGFLPETYDHPLAGRIIMPVHDASGNIIAVSTRVVQENKHTKLPKYWHEEYQKSFYLYGMNNAKESMRKWGFCVLTEGQFDVMQLHNHGMTNGVGLCGSTLHPVQISTILRYCDMVILLLDQDPNQSGEKAAQKIIKKFNSLDNAELKSYNIKIGVSRFGKTIDKTDADSFIRDYGIQPLKKILKTTVQELKEKYGM